LNVTEDSDEICTNTVRVEGGMEGASLVWVEEPETVSMFPKFPNVPPEKIPSYKNWLLKYYNINYDELMYNLTKVEYVNENNQSFYMDPAIYTIPDYIYMGEELELIR
jgi:hypothetical protein